MSEEKPVDDPLNPWRSMDRAPKDGTWVELKVAVGYKDGRVDPNSFPAKVYLAHWAEDLSGEYQPPFIGWFEKAGTYYRELPEPPYAWRPIKP